MGPASSASSFPKKRMFCLPSANSSSSSGGKSGIFRNGLVVVSVLGVVEVARTIAVVEAVDVVVEAVVDVVVEVVVVAEAVVEVTVEVETGVRVRA